MKNIVIVDDEPLILTAYKSLLSKQFNELHSFDNTYSAFKFINNHPQSIVITDIGMPGVDGTKFTKKLKKDFPDVQVIVTSGQLTENLKSELKNIGNVLGMFDKPVVFDDLIDLLSIHINSSDLN
jgi:DNA-binding NtrC family response regulator